MKYLIIAFLFSAPLCAQTLTPHKALYALELISDKPHEGIENASGEFYMEFSGNKCSGYIFTQKIKVHIQKEGEIILSDLSSTNFESGDSKIFQYQIKHMIDGKTVEDKAGKAEREGNEIKVTLSKPSVNTHKLPSNVLFPNEHMEAVIKAAKQNEKLFDAPLFDGSLDDGKYYTSLSIIGNPLKETHDAKLIDKYNNLMKKGVTIGYTETGKAKADGEVNFSISLNLLENGVAPLVNLINPSFALKGTLKSFEELPQEKCP